MANLQTGSLLGYLRGIASPGTEQASDRELLKRFSNQADESAFATLVHRHGAMVLRVARRILDQKQDAEDVFQASFLVLARKATRIVWRDSIASWLYQVAYRLAQEARANTSRCRHLEVGAAKPSVPADPLAAISLRETLQILEEELSKLPVSLRMPVVLCLLEGEGQQNSALRLGCSLATLKRRLARGRQVLQTRLARRGLALIAVLAGVEVSRGATGTATSALLTGTAIRAALAFQSSPASANAAVGRSVSLAQSMIKRGLLAKFALAGYIAVMSCAGIGLGLLWHRGKGAEGSASAGIEFQPSQGIRQAGDPLPSDLPAGAVARLGTLQLRAGFPGVIRHAPDGKIFLSIDNNRTLRTFDTTTGRILEQRQLPPLKESRDFQAAFSRKLDRLIARSEIGFDVWDLTRLEQLRSLRMEAPMAFRTALSPDDRTFAALELGGGNGILRLWDVESGETRVIGEHAGMIVGLAFSPDGQRIVTVDGTGSHCWQVATGKALWHNNKDPSGDRPIFLPDGNSFLGISNTQGPSLKRWDALTGKQIEPGKLPKIEFKTSVLISPNGQTMALLTRNKGIQFWDLKTGIEGGSHFERYGLLVFLPGRKDIAWRNGTTLARWDVGTGRALYTDTEPLGHLGPVHALAFTQNGSRLISSSSKDGTIRIWDLTSRKPVLQMNAAKIRYDVLAVSPDGKQIAGALEGLHEYGLIRVFDSTTGQQTHLLSARSPSIANERVILSALRFDSDGKQLYAFGVADDEAMGPTQSVLVALDVASTRQLYRRTGPPPEAAKCVTSDGRLFLSNDGRVFNTKSGKQLLDVKTNFGAFDTCTFSTDQSLLAGSISEPFQEETRGGIRMKGIKIWETASCKLVAEFPMSHLFNHLVFTPNARYLIGTDAAAIHVFDVLQNREISQLTNSRNVSSKTLGDYHASALSVSPDGRTLASGHADTTILLWNLPHPPEPGQYSLNETQLKEAWSTLASDDARKARVAMNDMALSPNQALPFLKTKLRPEKDSHAERIKELIADLDATEFKKRDSARQEMTALNELAEPFIREALNHSPSLEKRRRLELIQSSLNVSIPAKEMPLVRGIQILERIASPEAKQFLRDLAAGTPAARQTRLARESLERMDR